MKLLMILNEAPYGDERTYNALRLAHAIRKSDPNGEITVFLMADAGTAAKAGQRTPDGYYNIEMMLKRVISGGGRVLLCGTCMDARGLQDEDVIEDAARSTMDELAQMTLAGRQGDRVLEAGSRWTHHDGVTGHASLAKT